MGGYKGLDRTVCVFFVLSFFFLFFFSLFFYFVPRDKGVCWLSHGSGWGNGVFSFLSWYL
jgi:hypothetical protein